MKNFNLLIYFFNTVIYLITLAAPNPELKPKGKKKLVMVSF